MEKTNKEIITCPVQALLKLFKGKFSLEILTQISLGKNHYGQLLRTIPNINSRILAARLRFFEKEGILKRKILKATAPMNIEYQLTDKGLALRKIVDSMAEWQENYA